MVKQRKKNSRKKGVSKGFKRNRVKARKINASTAHDTCTESLSPFGGILGLIKFFDLIDFPEILTQPISRLVAIRSWGTIRWWSVY